jgi:hypothetical protein
MRAVLDHRRIRMGPGNRRSIKAATASWLCGTLLLCSAHAAGATAGAVELNSIARDYVGLVLELGEHDPGYVDAYYGLPQWQEQAKAGKRALPAIAAEARRLVALLEDARPADPLEVRRARFLALQLEAVLARSEMLQGRNLSFDEESRRLYGVVAPTHDEAHYRKALQALDAAMPGKGTLAERAEAQRQRLIAPADRVDELFRRGLEECRSRTSRRIALPANEDFRVEYVRDQPWAGYNWYKGDAHSLIQINLDVPFVVSEALQRACHEGYPGHHAFNALLEQRLVKERGWIEFSVYPLYSPQSFIAEGTADFGFDLAFPDQSKWSWLRREVFPAAGLDPQAADSQARIDELMKPLRHLRIDVARRYLDGQMSREEALRWITEYRLVSPQEAERYVRFIEKYRSYVINYSYGKDLVGAYVDSRGGSDEATRWAVFGALLSGPTVPAELAVPSVTGGSAE